MGPIRGPDHPARRRLGLKDEPIPAALPTLIILAVLGLLEDLGRHRVLFASRASDAFPIG